MPAQLIEVNYKYKIRSDKFPNKNRGHFDEEKLSHSKINLLQKSLLLQKIKSIQKSFVGSKKVRNFMKAKLSEINIYICRWEK